VDSVIAFQLRRVDEVGVIDLGERGWVAALPRIDDNRVVVVVEFPCGTCLDVTADRLTR